MSADATIRRSSRHWIRTRWAAYLGVALLGLLAHLPGLIDPAIYHDEVITRLLTAGNPDPAWPRSVVPAGQLESQVFGSSARPRQLVSDLRRFDVHPPVYFLVVSAWSSIFGRSLIVLRLFSVFTMVVAAIVFQSMLRRARHPAPVGTSLLLVSLSGVAVVGQAARPYGLAFCLVCLATWFLVSAAAETGTWHHILGCVLCCALAFLTSYLALFPVGALLAALVWVSWRRSKLWVLVIPSLIALSWLPWARFVVQQSRSRPGQDEGFQGWATQFVDLWRAHETLLWVTYHPLRSLLVGVLACVLVLACVRLRRPGDAALLWMLLSWTLIPTIGVVVLNLSFDKHLAEPRYFHLAAPGIAGLLGYSLGRFPKLGFLGVPFFALQLIALSQVATRGTMPSQLAATIAVGGPVSSVSLVGAGAGFDGFSGQVVSELEPDTPVVVLDEVGDLDVIEELVQPYDEVWLLAPPPHATRGLEDIAFGQLVESGAFRVRKANESACHLVRRRREPESTGRSPIEESRRPPVS